MCPVQSVTHVSGRSGSLTVERRSCTLNSVCSLRVTATFGETNTLVKGLIATHHNLLISLEYSKDTARICPRCVRTSPFQLVDAKVVLSLLGYC
jgi:hypothetical protein